MSRAKKQSVLVFMFKFVLIICLFFSAYVLFVMLGNVLGVIKFFPDPDSNAVYKNADQGSDAGSYVFIIDPGHGGADGGALGINGEEEKEFNLAISLKIGEFLSRAGAKVIFTRTEDVMLSLPGAPTKKSGDVAARVRIARANPDAVFVSVHQNKFPVEKYSGLQVFYSVNDRLSYVYAEAVRNAVVRYLQPDNARASKPAGSSIYVLDRISTPAILIECGFLSNPAELGLLGSESYRERLAFVIAHSLLSCSAELKDSGGVL